MTLMTAASTHGIICARCVSARNAGRERRQKELETTKVTKVHKGQVGHRCVLLRDPSCPLWFQIHRSGSMEALLDKLNPQQREAVEALNGPVLILAGAGSGKTRVITYRIAHLIENKGMAPDSILAVTFTNKAAAEMVERVDKLIGGRMLAKPLISTFHSFCVRVLRRDVEAMRIGDTGYKKDFAIYDESDQQSIVKGVMRRLGLDDK